MEQSSLEKQVIAQQVKEFPPLNGTRRFIVVPARARYRTLQRTSEFHERQEVSLLVQRLSASPD